MTVPEHSAFPWQSGDGEAEEGLTKREYLATQILSGLVAGNTASDNNYLAARAVKLTDKLIAELNKPVE